MTFEPEPQLLSASGWTYEVGTCKAAITRLSRPPLALKASRSLWNKIETAKALNTAGKDQLSANDCTKPKRKDGGLLEGVRKVFRTVN